LLKRWSGVRIIITVHVLAFVALNTFLKVVGGCQSCVCMHNCQPPISSRINGQIFSNPMMTQLLNWQKTDTIIQFFSYAWFICMNDSSHHQIVIQQRHQHRAVIWSRDSRCHSHEPARDRLYTGDWVVWASWWVESCWEESWFKLKSLLSLFLQFYIQGWPELFAFVICRVVLLVWIEVWFLHLLKAIDLTQESTTSHLVQSQSIYAASVALYQCQYDWWQSAKWSLINNIKEGSGVICPMPRLFIFCGLWTGLKPIASSVLA